MMQSNNIIINFAYSQDDVIVYSDLIKLKIALDNGEVLGMELAGYLNCHEVRSIPENVISIDKAIIPTEYNTEILCWEFKGKAGDNEFIVYINAENR